MQDQTDDRTLITRIAGQDQAVAEHAALDQEDVAHLRLEDVVPAVARAAVGRQGREVDVEQRRLVDAAGQEPRRGDHGVDQAAGVQVDDR